ncbi:hypothetical protein E3P99_01762 [Wallemia hederae]|uniref:Uncharacterized protein n=1 Tax=Wallemia hederae TaxID=1540922 RepID=A0A4T0FT20_9BASI|nr:hypothetical protein E3P99_01762 [Wallemia hederae]
MMRRAAKAAASRKRLGKQPSASLSDKLRSKRDSDDSVQSNSSGNVQKRENIASTASSHYTEDSLPSGFTDLSQRQRTSSRHSNPKKAEFRPQQNEKQYDMDPHKTTTISGIKVDQPRIPTLLPTLRRVLFQPSHPVWLRCPRTGVYSFPSHIEDIHPPEEFAFDRLPPYMTSSKDEELIQLTKKHKCRYLGSTSSMTAVLSHIHFLLTNWKPLNYESLSEEFQGLPNDYSFSNKLPAAIILRKVDDADGKSVYAIDKDKSYDIEEDNVLLWVGTQLEKQLTMDPEEFSGLLRANPLTDAVKSKMNEREAYHYSKVGVGVMIKILLMSPGQQDPDALATRRLRYQTAAQDIRYQDESCCGCEAGHTQLQGWRWIQHQEVSRSVRIIRTRVLRYGQERFLEVQVSASNSFSTQLKKDSLQARIGAMDGIFVAYHNTRRIFGFQYVPLEEMDERLHGSTAMATQSFKHSIGILERALDEATALIPDETLSITFDTREGTQYMSVYVESAEDTRADKPTYVIDFEVKSFVNNKQVPHDKHVDFSAVKEENPEWTVRLTTRTSTLADKDTVKPKLAQARQSLDFMNTVVLPPGMSTQDLVKLREERRTWRLPSASVEGVDSIEDKQKEELDHEKEQQEMGEEQAARPREEEEVQAVVRQRKPSSLVRQLRKLSKAGLEEQSLMKKKFGEDRVKNKDRFSDRMFANKSDASERRSRLLTARKSLTENTTEPTDKPPPAAKPSFSGSSADAYKAALRDVVSVEGKPLPSPNISTQLPLSRSRTQDEPRDGTAKQQQQRTAKMSRSNTTNSKPDKKPGRHFDVIDSWDVTAVTGSACEVDKLTGFYTVWHHDSPYDAVSPSRNNHNKAPVKAFDAQMLAESRHVKPAETDEERENRLRLEKKKRNPLLEVWGKHEEEPWEAFSANAPIQQPGRQRLQSEYNDSPLLPAKPQRRPSSRIPPPRPIKLGEDIDPDKPIQWSGNAGTGGRRATVGTSDTIKRSQSLLQRWKSNRRSPKPGHTSSASSASHTPSISPSPSSYDKGLPEPPAQSQSQSQFQAAQSTDKVTPPPQSPAKDKENEDQPLLSRKRSLLDKVKGLGKGVRTRSRDAKVA